MEIDLKLGEHMVLLGTTGSGKTQFYRRAMMPKFPRSLIIDTENREFPDVEPVRSTLSFNAQDGLNVAKAIPPTKPFRWRWVPPATWEKVQMERLAYGLISLRKRESMVVYFDEFSDFADANTIGPWLRSLFRKARKREQSMVLGTQRPAGVNKWAFDNSGHKLFFYVREYDRRGLDRLWPGISSELETIPWGSFESIYIDPAGTKHYLKAA